LIVVATHGIRVGGDWPDRSPLPGARNRRAALDQLRAGGRSVPAQANDDRALIGLSGQWPASGSAPLIPSSPPCARPPPKEPLAVFGLDPSVPYVIRPATRRASPQGIRPGAHRRAKALHPKADSGPPEFDPGYPPEIEAKLSSSSPAPTRLVFIEPRIEADQLRPGAGWRRPADSTDDPFVDSRHPASWGDGPAHPRTWLTPFVARTARPVREGPPPASRDPSSMTSGPRRSGDLVLQHRSGLGVSSPAKAGAGSSSVPGLPRPTGAFTEDRLD